VNLSVYVNRTQKADCILRVFSLSDIDAVKERDSVVIGACARRGCGEEEQREDSYEDATHLDLLPKGRPTLGGPAGPYRIRKRSAGGSAAESDWLPPGRDGLSGYRHLLDDLDVEALKGRNVCRCVREQADLVDSEVSEDLTTESDLAKDALVLVVVVRAGLAMEEYPVRLN
jgi:hypothetical protein